jgi:hypothetical protein
MRRGRRGEKEEEGRKGTRGEGGQGPSTRGNLIFFSIGSCNTIFCKTRDGGGYKVHVGLLDGREIGGGDQESLAARDVCRDKDFGKFWVFDLWRVRRKGERVDGEQEK